MKRTQKQLLCISEGHIECEKAGFLIVGLFISSPSLSPPTSPPPPSPPPPPQPLPDNDNSSVSDCGGPCI